MGLGVEEKTGTPTLVSGGAGHPATLTVSGKRSVTTSRTNCGAFEIAPGTSVPANRTERVGAFAASTSDWDRALRSVTSLGPSVGCADEPRWVTGLDATSPSVDRVTTLGEEGWARVNSGVEEGAGTTSSDCESAGHSASMTVSGKGSATASTTRCRALEVAVGIPAGCRCTEEIVG